MQIHELNNYNGELGSGAYLAVDDGNDTGRLSVAGLNQPIKEQIDQLESSLNGRIDNIIAGGTAPSAAEVTDARYGADGITYPSLGAAIRGQIGETDDNLSNLAKDFIAFAQTANIKTLYSPFVNGGLDGINISNEKFRIVTKNIVNPYDTVRFIIKSGYMIGYSTCDEGGSFISFSGWKTGTVIIPTGNRIRICVRKETEDVSVTADINEFASAIKVTTLVDKVFRGLDSIEASIQGIFDGLKIIPVLDYDVYYNRRSAGAALVPDTKSCVSMETYEVETGDVIQIETGYVILLTKTDGSYYGAWSSGSYTVQSDDTVYIEVRNSSQTALTDEEVENMPNVVRIERSIGIAALDPVARSEITALRGECFIAPNGSDSNSGTRVSPFATISHAISEGYRNICVMDGEYTEQINISEVSNINIYADNYTAYADFPNTERPRPTFTNGTKITTFTSSGGYKYFTLVSAPARYNEVFVAQTRTPTETVNGRIRNSAGLWANFNDKFKDKQLKPVLSIGALSEADTFYYDGSKVYFNTDADISSVTVVGDAANLATISKCNNVKISGLVFEYGFSRNLFMPWCNNVRIENCEFAHSTQTHNTEFTMSDVTLVNCLSCLAGLDGFNSSYYGVTRLINCKGLYNFDDGESSHEYCEIIVEGGEYAYNGKGGHAPVHGCKFSCNGTYTHDNAYGFYLAGAGGFIIPELLISNSVAINNTSKDLLNILYITKLMNTKVGTTQVSSGSVTDLTA